MNQVDMTTLSSANGNTNAIIMASESSHDLNNGWSTKQENVLNNLSKNSLKYYKCHNNYYSLFQFSLNCFRIPTIVLSAITGFIAVGLQSYANQKVISIVTCLISLFVGILNSIELYLNIDKNVEKELNLSKSFYDLYFTTDLIINLDPKDRLNLIKKLHTKDSIPGVEFDIPTYIQYTINTYMELVKQSNVSPDALASIVLDEMGNSISQRLSKLLFGDKKSQLPNGLDINKVVDYLNSLSAEDIIDFKEKIDESKTKIHKLKNDLDFDNVIDYLNTLPNDKINELKGKISTTKSQHRKLNNGLDPNKGTAYTVTSISDDINDLHVSDGHVDLELG